MPKPYHSLLHTHHNTSMSLLPMVDVTSVSKQALMHCALFCSLFYSSSFMPSYYAFKVHLLSCL